MHQLSLSFENKTGDLLAGKLDCPLDGKPLAYALFAHCFTCSKNLKSVEYITRALTAQGLGVFRFDFTGLGASEGEFADTNFSSNVEDLVSAAEFLSQEWEAPQLLIGHSLGGAAVLHAAHRLPSVKAVVTIAAPSEPSYMTELLEDSLDEIESEGKARVNLAGRTFTIKKQFLDDLDKKVMEPCVRDLNKALLVMHAPDDSIVSMDNAQRLFSLASGPRNFVTLDGADHLLTAKEDALYVGNVIAPWAMRYLTLPEPEEVHDHSTQHVVVETGKEGYRTEMRCREHSWIADEPKDLGGTDTGPTPNELLTSALGGCTSITVQMYARRKNWPLESVEVEVKHSKIAAKDCEDCDSTSGKVDIFERIIHLKGPLTDEQKDRMMQIADKCPVHRTLHGEVKIRTRQKDTTGA
jgi:putative redox protein